MSKGSCVEVNEPFAKNQDTFLPRYFLQHTLLKFFARIFLLGLDFLPGLGFHSRPTQDQKSLFRVDIKYSMERTRCK